MQALVEKAHARRRGRILDGPDLHSRHVLEHRGGGRARQRRPAKYGGVYASHMRDEGAKVLEAITKLSRSARKPACPCNCPISRSTTSGFGASSDKSLALVEKFRREGVDVVVDQYPYDQSSTNLGITLPSWALADGPTAIRRASCRSRDPGSYRRRDAEDR